jgi:predicted nucleic acid-binding protein
VGKGQVYHIDTNVIVQLLAKQNKEHSAMAKALFDKVARQEIELFLEPSVVAECFYVLEKYCNIPREEVVDQLSKNVIGLKNVTTYNKKALIQSLVYYRNDPELDFVDTYLGCLSKVLNIPAITFNTKHFNKTGCKNYTPDQI